MTPAEKAAQRNAEIEAGKRIVRKARFEERKDVKIRRPKMRDDNGRAIKPRPTEVTVEVTTRQGVLTFTDTVIGFPSDALLLQVAMVTE